MDSISVDPDDVRAVASVVLLLQQAPGACFFPGLDAAVPACSRLMQAAAGYALPQSPVSAFDQVAITHSAMLDAYTSQGFTRDEALVFVQAFAHAGFTAHALRGAVSG